MGSKSAQSFIAEQLKSVGVTINGSQDYDIQVYKDEFYTRVLHEGSLGLGESFVEKWWDCARVDLFIEKVRRANLSAQLKSNVNLLLRSFLLKMVNFQTKKGALTVGKKHYDLGNTLFKCMLDKEMNYSCGYWKNAANLDEAQIAKMDLVCQKLLLKPHMTLLDIGCGWGALAKHAAKKYGVSVVGVTISKEQYEYAKINCAGLPIEIRFQDYRDVKDKFDRICSIGMLEHVGHFNYRAFMETGHRCLEDDGIFLVHTIGDRKFSTPDAWMTKYIFPNYAVPSMGLLDKAVEDLFVIEDVHNFGADYAKTTMAWQQNFVANWDQLRANYDDAFYRMWNYYLLTCAGNFRARMLQVWQIVLSKNGIIGGYLAPR